VKAVDEAGEGCLLGAYLAEQRIRSRLAGAAADDGGLDV
jgi:hypothetical protein